MSIANEFLELEHDMLYQAMGLPKSDNSSVMIANRILQAKDALTLVRIAKDIRKLRFIRVCAWHQPEQAWWDGQDWIIGNIPPGRLTHTICETCLKGMSSNQGDLKS